MKNNNKGITLVALVITIIVLLILAGVTIAALSGDNGILTRGKQAKIDNAVGNAKDIINLAANEGLAAYYGKTYSNIAYEGGKSYGTQDAAIIGYIEAALNANGITVGEPGKGLVVKKEANGYTVHYDSTLKATFTVLEGKTSWT